MRSRFKIAAAITLGALLNIATAWALAAIPRNLAGNPNVGSIAFPGGGRSAFQSWNFFGLEKIRWVSPLYWDPNWEKRMPAASGPSWSGLTTKTEWPLTAPQHMRIEIAAGWPMRTLRLRYYVRHVPTSVNFEASGLLLTKLADAKGTGLESVEALPLVPVGQGVLINTAFYAALVIAIMKLPGCVVRARRRRKGLCVWCAYPRGQSGVCSECGKWIA